MLKPPTLTPKLLRPIYELPSGRMELSDERLERIGGNEQRMIALHFEMLPDSIEWRASRDIMTMTTTLEWRHPGHDWPKR